MRTRRFALASSFGTLCTVIDLRQRKRLNWTGAFNSSHHCYRPRKQTTEELPRRSDAAKIRPRMPVAERP